MKALQKIHIHLVSDSTGETVHQISRACLAQFPAVKTIEHVWTLVRSDQHLEAIFTSLERNPGVLLMSILDIDLRTRIEEKCKTPAGAACVGTRSGGQFIRHRSWSNHEQAQGPASAG